MNTNPNSYAVHQMNYPNEHNPLGIKPINWHLALSALEKLLINKPDKIFQAMDLIGKLTNASGNWVTCAVGNQCKIIPRDEDGEPIDRSLASQGTLFHSELRTCEEHIRRNEIAAAIYTLKYVKAILGLIEERSAELLKKLTTKPE